MAEYQTHEHDVLIIGAGGAGLSAAVEASAAGLKVPPGFVVTEFAGDDLAHDVYTLTLDPQGRVVVAGRGYIRVLIDDDGDGRADRAVEFADGPRDGAMGLLWEGDTLYVTGDGGLRRYRGARCTDDGSQADDGPGAYDGGRARFLARCCRGTQRKLAQPQRPGADAFTRALPRSGQRGSLLGPRFDGTEIRGFLDRVGARYRSFETEEELCRYVAKQIGSPPSRSLSQPSSTACYATCG